MLTKSELAAWVADLRTNGHLQGKGMLCQEDSEGNLKFCGLGRLAEIQAIPRNQKTEKLWEYKFSQRREHHVSGRLAGPLMEKLGGYGLGDFRKMNMPQLFTDGGHEASLASANDAGVTFAQLADHLERYYPAIDDPIEPGQSLPA